MKAHILDDWFDTLHRLPGFARLDGHDVTIWNIHVVDAGILAERLAEAEALLLFRERIPIAAELLERLPKRRLISQHSFFPHIDAGAPIRMTNPEALKAE